MHGQIVLCPGWNDGAVLERTLDELAALHPALETVGIVPVGLIRTSPRGTGGARGDARRRGSRARPRGAPATTWLPRLGTRLVFAADEFYLAAGRPLPSAAAYEEFVQQENGIGLARLFLDELAELPPVTSRRVTPPS